MDAMSWVCPLPLLCALVLVPPEFHELLRAKVKSELKRMRGEVFDRLADATGRLPREWPNPAQAADLLQGAAMGARDVERLALDWAAANAMEG